MVVVGPKAIQVPTYAVEEDAVEAEIQRFKTALLKTREELNAITADLCRRVENDEAGIFEAHLLILEDQTIIDEVTQLVGEKRINVEAAFDQVTQKFAAALDAVDDSYLRERAVDMRDVASRVTANLMGGNAGDPLSDLREPSIIIGHDLSPSMTATFDRDKVLGFATDVGSPTSHTAILARSLNLPAVVGLRDASLRLRSGQTALLDGYDGVVITNPSETTLYAYGEVVRQHEDFDNRLQNLRELPAETVDHVRIHLMGNIDHPDEVDDVSQFGGEGIGLFRTEYLFLNRKTLPNETQQFEAYRDAASRLQSGRLLVRTLDLGADKVADSLPEFQEANPALGLRAIRFCLQNPGVFKSQLRAILRASAFGQVSLLYPMISSLDELIAANRLLDECRAELRSEGQAFDPEMPVGAMIETPAAAMMADILAKEISFFSIGTNDLIQYGAAVDRMNERIAHLYEPTHPGILRLIKNVVESSDRCGVDVGVCGEMAGDPLMVPLLIGLGLRHLSAPAPLIPQVKYLIRQLTMPVALELAERALSARSGQNVIAACREVVKQTAPALVS